MLTDATKLKISEKLSEYILKVGSQKKASNTLKGVSDATLSQMRNGKWKLITDEMWRNVASQIDYKTNEWVTVETRDSRMLTALLTDAKENSLVFAVTGDAGTGKTHTLKRFSDANKRVYVLHCCEFWNRKAFLQELLTVLGRDYSGYTISEMMHEIVHQIKTQECPLLVFDEADKLPDPLLYFFITLYNQLEDHCGIVLLATDHLSKRIKRGLKLNKKGYKEMYSRLGRKFIELSGVSTTDITAVCMANGVTEHKLIKHVIEDCENDLRRVKRKIHAIKKASA